MTAEARILLEAVASRYVSNAVAEEAAEGAHLLLEGRRRRIWIVLRLEQQRMPA